MKQESQQHVLVDGFANSYTTRCGGELRVTARARKHLLAHPEMTHELMLELASKLDLPRDNRLRLATEVDMGRTLAHSIVVPAPKVNQKNFVINYEILLIYLWCWNNNRVCKRPSHVYLCC
eukprot:GEZU01030452.1.p1 GENE.GEZU01030452.1~~GEZU01030452.1.p1  ORF type:complete len:121 (+),score=6.05 GEZU01030452.1:39-401(+)